jgi:uncharacterized membrane protein
MYQSRFQNGGLWVSLILLAITLLVQMGLGYVIPVGIDVFMVGVVTICAFLGVVSNPKDGKWFWSPNTPWSVRLRDYKTWVGIIAILAALVAQILKWFNLMPLPFDMMAVLMTFLTILQSVGVINGESPEQIMLITEKLQQKGTTSDEVAAGAVTEEAQ